MVLDLADGMAWRSEDGGGVRGQGSWVLLSWECGQVPVRPWWQCRTLGGELICVFERSKFVEP